MTNYITMLREHNLKATPQRLEIASLLERYGHITIDTLYTQMLHKFNSISLATIYKNINLMLENSFIQEVKIPNEKSYYELSKEEHSHLVCRECGNVEDISLDLSVITETLSRESSFKVEKADLVISGICHNCRSL